MLREEYTEDQNDDGWLDVELKSRQIIDIESAMKGIRLWRVMNLYLDRNCIKDIPQSMLKALVNLQRVHWIITLCHGLTFRI